MELRRVWGGLRNLLGRQGSEVFRISPPQKGVLRLCGFRSLKGAALLTIKAPTLRISWFPPWWFVA